MLLQLRYLNLTFAFNCMTVCLISFMLYCEMGCILLLIGMADLGDVMPGEAPEVEEVPAVGGANHGQGNGAQQRLQWTNAMSGFILRRFSDLVAEGVKTDKGFKEVHLNAVAKQLSEFSNIEVSGNQVYNHLRKWRARWVKICRLRELSGALWDEDNYMITLETEHYNGHVRVTDTETYIL